MEAIGNLHALSALTSGKTPLPIEMEGEWGAGRV